MTIIDLRNPPSDPFLHDGPETSWERPMSEQPTCKTCKFWRYEWCETGLCCRRAPMNATGSARWPESDADDWCGEHTPKQSTTD